MDPTRSLDPDTVSIPAAQQQPRPGQSVGIVNAAAGPLGDLLGGALGLGAATTRVTTNVVASSAGPALLLLLGGFALATFARRKKR